MSGEMTYMEEKRAKNLFYQYPKGPGGSGRERDHEINRWISLYGNSKDVINFLGDSSHTIGLLWELVTAKCGKVCFEYTVGAAIVSGGGGSQGKKYRTSAGTVQRAVCYLFLLVMADEAGVKYEP